VIDQDIQISKSARAWTIQLGRAGFWSLFFQMHIADEVVGLQRGGTLNLVLSFSA
jgi:hypothetical protein